MRNTCRSKGSLLPTLTWGEDNSSLVNYFGVLGKQVFYTDWKVTEEWNEDERGMFSFWDCYFENE